VMMAGQGAEERPTQYDALPEPWPQGRIASGIEHQLHQPHPTEVWRIRRCCVCDGAHGLGQPQIKAGLRLVAFRDAGIVRAPGIGPTLENAGNAHGVRAIGKAPGLERTCAE
jgi:hypothetical protein